MLSRALSLLPVLLLAASAPCAASDNGSGPNAFSVPPARFQTADGRTWERIPLQYTDVQAIARVLGAPVLPNEADVWAMKARAFMGGQPPYGAMSPGGFSGGYGAPAGGMIGSFGSGFPGAAAGYSGPFGDVRRYGDANATGYAGSASGAFYRAVNGPGYGFLPNATAAQWGNRGAAILGDRNSNSLLVGPGNSGGAQGGPLFPGLVIFGDRNTNSLLVDP